MTLGTGAVPGARPLPRSPGGRGFFALWIAGALFLSTAAARGQEHHGEHEPRWALGAQVIPLLTHATPAVHGEDLTELYLTQPAVMGRARLLGGRLELQGMLNLEGLTLERGELNAGIWGEGYVDRRHPHTYLHEAMATVRLPELRSVAASVSFGKGFAPFGTDDPMARPFVKYPANHHLAQVLERLVGIGALRAGPVLLEAGVFNGDEPSGPAAFATLDRFGDSWAVRASLLPFPGLEAQASYASLASPELPTGGGLDHRKWSASARFESAGHNGTGRYVLVEWARTVEYDDGRRGVDYSTGLVEAALRRGGAEVALRLERTERPEEERLLDPFRTPRPHVGVHLLGMTRWDIVSARAGREFQTAGAIHAGPFIEASHLMARETVQPSFFVPAEFYGSDRMWSLSAGVRVAWGMSHQRMGRYGASRVNEH